ncbi:uncharacterized protein LOC135162714 [Diachasmimorpha longicaudata]|uniref:uncharacterized protein LOC135162714 n=1 Tax=Diachasmimorpha longicaudata TaxID=58733 RepID=UPI0030B8E0D8
MPRSTKESDDEFEPRGRRTRATASSVTDSPLRRSTRRRATTKDDSSPEPVTSDVGPSTRAKRRITPTLESAHAESVRNLRSRKTSTTSDVSEATESDTGSEAKRRTTRRSSLALSGIETPTKARLRRTIRAGSESKTISPMVRLTRRTRASSVDPEATDERAPMTPSTPLHTRKGRASMQPSELPVLEEIQKHEKDVPHEDDDVFLTQSSPSKLSAPSPKTPVLQKSTPTLMHKNEQPIKALHEALITSTTSRAPQDSADTRQKLMDNASGNTLNDIPKVLVEKAHVKASPGNKENEKTPKSTRDHSSKLFKATGGDRKSLSSTVLERLEVDSRSNIDDQLSKSKSPSMALEKVITLEPDVSEKKGLEEKEDSIIFIDDTDTDEAPVEVFRDDKSTNKGLNHDEIIIADAGSNEISPCKSQTPEGDSPGVDSKPEIIEENFKEVEQVEDQVEAELKDLFKDIPADNWKSGGSKSPVDIEDEDKSDTGSDIVLVGWSADENELDEKTKKNFNYDSDDTVIIQKRKQSSAGHKGSLDHGGEENKNLQRKSGKSLNHSTGDDVDELGEKSRKGTRKSLRKSQHPAEEESVNSDVEDELNKSRDLIYRFESGIINFEENFNESKRKSDVDSQGKHPEGSVESRASLSGGRKSTGKSGNNDQGENAKAEESPDKSRKSIPLSEVRKSLEKSKNPVEEEIDDEAMDVDVVGDDEMEISDYHPKESPQVDAPGDELIEVDNKPEAGEVNSKPSETLISSSNGIVHDGHSMSPNVSESASTLRRSALRNSVNEGRAEGEEKENENSAAVEEETSEVDNVSDKARRSANQSELRVSLCKINTPVKQQEMSSLEKHEELLLGDKSENVLRKSLSVSKTPTKVQQEDGKSSSEDEDPEDITKKFNKSKEELIESRENIESSLEETSALEGNDTSKTGETLKKCERSLRRSLNQSKSQDDEKASHQQRNSLAVEISSLANTQEDEDEQKNDEGISEGEETLNESQKSLRRSSYAPKADEGDDKVSPQKRKSLPLEESTLEKPRDEESVGVEGTLYKLRRSLRKSLTQSKQDESENSEISKEVSPQKGNSIAADELSEGEDDDDDDEDDENTPELEALKKSWRNLRKSLNESNTQSIEKDDQESNESEETSQERKSTSAEEDEVEEAPGINESLTQSRKSLNKSLNKSKTPVKKNDDVLSKKSPKVLSQNRKSLASEKSSSEQEEEDEEIPEIEKSLDKSRKSLEKSLIKSKTPVKKSINDLSKKSPKISPQKRKSLATVKSSEEEEKEEETPEMEVSLNKSRKSVEKSAIKPKTPVKTSVDDLPKKFPKTTLQKRKSLTVEESLSSEEEADEEIFNKSTKSPKKSAIESKTPSKQKDTEQPQKTPKTRLQTRKSLVLEKSHSSEKEEEALEVEETLSKSASTLRRSQIESKTPSKQNGEGSKASPKPSPQTLGESSSAEDDEKESEDVDEQRSLSTQVQVNSNSDPDEDIDSDIEQSRVVVSSLLYDDDSETSNSDMNSDIEKEYNLNGADVEEYSDDGIPGDDLRKSDSEESGSDEEEDDEDEFDDFINDDEEEEEDNEEDEDESEENEEENEEDVEDHEDETVEIDDEDEEVFVSPPKPTKKGHEKLKLKETKKSISESLEDTSGNSSLETGKSESTKKNKKKTAEVLTSVKPSVSSPPKFSAIATKLPKSVASLKESKLEKKSKVNLTMSLDDPDLADTRLLMKEKLNDSMPILNMKRLSARRSDLQVLPEDKEEKKKTKSKGKKHSVSEKLTDKSEEVTVSSSDKKSKKTKKSNNSEQSNATNESTKRKKSKEVDLEITSDVPRLKKKKVQVEQLADSDSDDGPEVSSFTRGRDQALTAAKGQQESIKAAKETKKSHKKMKGTKPENPSVVSRKPIEQLPEETLSNLSDIPLRPKRKREINDDVFVPTKTMFDVKNKKPKTMSIDDEFVPLSLSGGTTTFEVVTLKEKRGKKTSPVRSFKERMMNRVPRQPTSAYMVYQRKLQASGKNKY